MNNSNLAKSASTNTFLWFCMGPVLLFLIIVVVAPLTLAIVDSLRDLSLTLLTKRGQYIGLDNFRDLIGADNKFYIAVAHTTIFVAVVVPI
ncbi:MAG: hypothetical protein OEQ39_23090, partial [Gammaproteobacteria bacterium]|nr:hypothetical protein [Gammaproteobacteria bacterium]